MRSLVRPSTMMIPENGNPVRASAGRIRKMLVESVFSQARPELFLRFEDAEQAGLEAGKNWVELGFKKVLAS